MGSILRVSSNLMPIFGVRKSKLIWPEGKKLVPLNLGLVSYHDPCLVLMCFFLVFWMPKCWLLTTSRVNACSTKDHRRHVRHGHWMVLPTLTALPFGWGRGVSQSHGGGHPKGRAWKTFSFLFGEGFLNASATFRECSFKPRLKINLI